MSNPSDNNIVHFAPRPKPEPQPPKAPHPPMFNLPPATKILAGIMLGVQLVIFLLSQTIEPNALSIAAYYGGFMPLSWTDPDNFHVWTPLSLISFSFLHGGWMHLAFNLLMLVAMGSGLERVIGVKKYLAVFAVTTLFAAAAHLAIYPDSLMPIVGASGGISGIFGAMIVVLNQVHNADMAQEKTRLMPIIVIYIAISVITGLMGAPDGSEIAWLAHIGGFLAGIGIMMMWLKQRR